MDFERIGFYHVQESYNIVSGQLIVCGIVDEIENERMVPSFGHREMQRHLTDGLTLPSERSMVWFQIELRQEKIIIPDEFS